MCGRRVSSGESLPSWLTLADNSNPSNYTCQSNQRASWLWISLQSSDTQSCSCPWLL